MSIVVWGGRRYSPDMRDCMQEWQRLAKLEGIPFRVTQGGFNRGVSASAKTHWGDAADVSVSGLSRDQVSRLVALGRMVGLAVWFRTTKTAKWGTRAQGFGSYHLHAVPNGWGAPHAEAKAQADAYRRGRDGLRGNGTDSGPGHVAVYRARTWAQYKSMNATKELFTVDQFNKIMAAIAAVDAKVAYTQDQLKAVAAGTYSRDAINARNAETASIVAGAVQAGTKVVVNEVKGVTVDAAGVADRVRDELEKIKLTVEVS